MVLANPTHTALKHEGRSSTFCKQAMCSLNCLPSQAMCSLNCVPSQAMCPLNCVP